MYKSYLDERSPEKTAGGNWKQKLVLSQKLKLVRFNVRKKADIMGAKDEDFNNVSKLPEKATANIKHLIDLCYSLMAN